MAVVYILRSLKTQFLYIGSTINFAHRLAQHQKGLVISTKAYTPFCVELIQEYKTIAEAKNIEYRMKKLKNKRYIEKMIEDEFIKMRPR